MKDTPTEKGFSYRNGRIWKEKGYEMNRLRLEFENQSRNRRYKKIKNKNKEQLRSVVSKTNDLKGGNY